MSKKIITEVDLVDDLVYYKNILVKRVRFMAVVNVHDAKTNFSRLLSRVESGEEVVIAKAGKPVARIVPLVRKVDSRKPGSAKGRIKVKKSFFEPLPEEILNQFEK